MIPALPMATPLQAATTIKHVNKFRIAKWLPCCSLVVSFDRGGTTGPKVRERRASFMLAQRKIRNAYMYTHVRIFSGKYVILTEIRICTAKYVQITFLIAYFHFWLRICVLKRAKYAVLIFLWAILGPSFGLF
jgi:hypothetical protein